MIVLQMVYVMLRMVSASVFKDTLEKIALWVAAQATVPTMGFATVVNVLVMMVTWGKFATFNYAQMTALIMGYARMVFASATLDGHLMIVASRLVISAFMGYAMEQHASAKKVGLDGLAT
jgi:hypothetical protein